MEFWFNIKNRRKINAALLSEIDKLKPNQVKYLPKSYLLKLSPSTLERIWKNISKKLQKDQDIQLRRPCYDHYNRPEDLSHIDGPAPSKKACYDCNRQQ